MLIALVQRGPQLRDYPISHFRLSHTIPTFRGRQQRSRSILTRISPTFLVAEREVSQNGILIRVMCLMEFFQRPRETCQATV
jgi:hypothetical protein